MPTYHASLQDALKLQRTMSVGKTSPARQVRRRTGILTSRMNVSIVRLRTSVVAALPVRWRLGDFMKNGRKDAEVRRFSEDRLAAEAARNDAEQFRRLAEEAREVRDHHREALETIRQERERLRDTAETARTASEEARIAAETARTAGEEARVATEAARHAVVDALRATADSMNASLEQMKAVEDMRRTLREIRDVIKLDSN
jgi:hypothetical protein